MIKITYNKKKLLGIVGKINLENYDDKKILGHEETFVERIKKRSIDFSELFELEKIDDYGVDGDFIESQAFAYLAIRSYLKLPISYPETTGVKKPSTGGVVIKI